jgi:hypothetical protein
MDQIYKEAHEVIAWLGESSNDSDIAFDLIEEWARWDEKPKHLLIQEKGREILLAEVV